MMKILVLSALVAEQRFYKARLDFQENIKVGYIDVAICKQNECTLYFATTGMGTTNASITVATLATSLKIDVILFSGTSGGIDPTFAIGDVVIGDPAFDADIFTIHDAVTGTPFESALINPNTKTMTPKFFQPCPKLLALAQSITNNEHDHKVISGMIASSNHFPSPKPLFDLIKQNGAHVIDMETSAIYQYGWLTGTPTLAIRGVSNRLDTTGDDEDTNNCDVDTSAANAARLVLQIATQLIPEHSIQ